MMGSTISQFPPSVRCLRHLRPTPCWAAAYPVRRLPAILPPIQTLEDLPAAEHDMQARILTQACMAAAARARLRYGTYDVSLMRIYNRGRGGPAHILTKLLRNALNVAVRPNTSTHVAGAGGEVAAGRAGSHRDDRVLVSLEEQLRRSGAGIPELDATVLGAGHDPVCVRGQGNAEDKVLTKS